jgi:quercetin dioxygenase-like cupin family protein
MQPTAERTRHFRSLEGRRYEVGPATLSFKRGEREDEGAYSLFELLEPPGARVDLHRHPAFQETFVVLEGRFDFEADGERYSLGPGETLVVPRGAAHGYTCTSPGSGRLLTISTPPRLFEAFVADISAANLEPSVDIGAVFARHGVELLPATGL